jgi:hypothetical protein
MNINRLYLDVASSLVRYLATLKISLLRSCDSKEASDLLTSALLRFSTPTSAIWLKVLVRGENEEFLNLFEKESEDKIEIATILSEFLSRQLDSSSAMAETIEAFKKDFEQDEFQCSSNQEILEILIAYEERISSQDLDRSRSRVELGNVYLRETIAYLLAELSPLFEYKIGTLESYVADGKKVKGFFRVHYGQTYLACSQSVANRSRIGSVFLMKEDAEDSYSQILELSPFLVQFECNEVDCKETSLYFYSSFHAGHGRFSNYHCDHVLKDKQFSEWFQNHWSKPTDITFINENEELYYRKIYSYWAMGIVDEKEEQALQIMHKVFNIGMERLRVIEEKVKQELGISDDQEASKRKNSYRELFEELTQSNFLQDMERFTLQELARTLGLRNTETWELELKTWIAKARELFNKDDKESLTEILVQIARIDFQNPILQEGLDQFGINTEEDFRIINRRKLFSEYLGYLNIVYTDKVVTPDERRFLEIQRKRLGLTEKEAFELEFLEDNLVGVLEHQRDDTYLMQKENFKLGGILLAKALITDEQLNHALEVQTRDKGIKLGAMLYELGYIGPNELKRCLDLQEHLYFRKDSYLIGSIALKFALIDQRQLKEGLRVQEAVFRDHGKHQPLGEILLSRGFISHQTLDFILSIQRLSTEQ